MVCGSIFSQSQRVILASDLAKGQSKISEHIPGGFVEGVDKAPLSWSTYPVVSSELICRTCSLVLCYSRVSGFYFWSTIGLEDGARHSSCMLNHGDSAISDSTQPMRRAAFGAYTDRVETEELCAKMQISRHIRSLISGSTNKDCIQVDQPRCFPEDFLRLSLTKYCLIAS